MFQPIAMGTNSSEIKLHNLSRFCSICFPNDIDSRVSLTHRLGVSTATITNLVSELVEQGLIVEEGSIRNSGQNNVGRRQRHSNSCPMLVVRRESILM